MNKSIEKLLVNEMVKQSITEAINKLGIEATIETIESISAPILRLRLRAELSKRLQK